MAASTTAMGMTPLLGRASGGKRPRGGTERATDGRMDWSQMFAAMSTVERILAVIAWMVMVAGAVLHLGLGKGLVKALSGKTDLPK